VATVAQLDNVHYTLMGMSHALKCASTKSVLKDFEYFCHHGAEGTTTARASDLASFGHKVKFRFLTFV
jgi:hypothetical protein